MDEDEEDGWGGGGGGTDVPSTSSLSSCRRTEAAQAVSCRRQRIAFRFAAVGDGQPRSESDSCEDEGGEGGVDVAWVDDCDDEDDHCEDAPSSEGGESLNDRGELLRDRLPLRRDVEFDADGWRYGARMTSPPSDLPTP